MEGQISWVEGVADEKLEGLWLEGKGVCEGEVRRMKHGGEWAGREEKAAGSRLMGVVVC